MNMKMLAGGAAIAVALMAGTAQAGPHDWTGFYTDAYIGHWVNPPIGNYGGVNLGYNFSSGGPLIYGAELGVLSAPGPSLTGASLSGRIGAAVSDNAMVFARLGLGRYNFGFNTLEFGAGGQYAFSDNMYLRGELAGLRILGTGVMASSVRLGLGFDF